MSLEKADDLRRQVQERMSERPLNKLSDPAQSDVRSAEIVEGIDRLLGAAIALLRGGVVREVITGALRAGLRPWRQQLA